MRNVFLTLCFLVTNTGAAFAASCPNFAGSYRPISSFQTSNVRFTQNADCTNLVESFIDGFGNANTLIFPSDKRIHRVSKVGDMVMSGYYTKVSLRYSQTDYANEFPETFNVTFEKDPSTGDLLVSESYGNSAEGKKYRYVKVSD